MKTRLTLFSILLLATSAWAGHNPTTDRAQDACIGDDGTLTSCAREKTLTQIPACLVKMEAAMREHDALDEAMLTLQREYSIIPGWLHDSAPQHGNICLSLGGAYRCGDEANWPREITKYSIEQAEKQVEEDKKLLAKREAYHTEKTRKERLLEQRRTAFTKQWDDVKRECWRQP